MALFIEPLMFVESIRGAVPLPNTPGLFSSESTCVYLSAPLESAVLNKPHDFTHLLPLPPSYYGLVCIHIPLVITALTFLPSL